MIDEWMDEREVTVNVSRTLGPGQLGSFYNSWCRAKCKTTAKMWRFKFPVTDHDKNQQ